MQSSVLGGPEFRADLEALQIGLGRKVTELRRQAAEELARTAAQFVPLGPGPQSPRDNLPHIRDTIKGRAQGVVAFHPAGLVTEFGGTIKPRGAAVRIPARHQAAKALQVEFARVEELLSTAMDELIASTVR
jgi:anthranilate/para-aminobenzoate synthase component II